MGPVLVAAVGSELRTDDGAGPAVVALVAELLAGARSGAAHGTVDLALVADPLDLVGRWDGARLAVVVDAVRSGAAPGTVAVVELDGVGALPLGSASTHTLGVARALSLGRALGRAPARVVLVGIEGADFGVGAGLTPAVARAVPAAARRVVGLVAGAAQCA